MINHEYFMKQAIIEAHKALDKNEVPIGAVIVCQQKIIGRGFNQVEMLNDPSAHAEMIAITAACNYLNSKYLLESSIYITIEPCIMCAGAIAWAQIPNIYFGAHEPKHGFTNLGKNILHPKAQYVGNILQNECASLMQDFFKAKRN